jgi:cytochrome c peroxidase
MKRVLLIFSIGLLLAFYIACLNTKAQKIDKATIGHYLFFDENLSLNQTKSCGSCHNPSLYFTDGYKQAMGQYADIQLRNTPSLLNAVDAQTLNWANPDVTSFEAQMVTPLFSKAHNEMAMNRQDNARVVRLLSQKKYASFHLQDSQKNWQFIIDALADYQRNLVSRKSLFDQYIADNDDDIFSENIQKGHELFLEKCASCHGGTDLNVANNSERFMFSPIYTLPEYAQKEDKGVFLTTQKKEDIGKFRIPSLRNVCKTPPYMHDGSLPTLDSAIQKHLLPKETLPKVEIRQLIFFLETLTDSSFLKNPFFTSPFLVKE